MERHLSPYLQRLVKRLAQSPTVTRRSDAVTVVLPPPFYMNQSRWKTYQLCDRLYAWEQIENLSSIRPRRPLVLGSAVHRAQVLIHQKGNTTEAIAEATKGAQKFFEEGMRAGGSQFMDDEEQIQNGKKLLGDLLPAYHHHWRELGQIWKPLGQELSFKVEVGEGTNVWLVGTIDNLVTFMQGLWLVDYKTMDRLDKRNFMQYEIDIQLTAYIYGGSKQLSLDAAKQGKPPVIIRGAIIDGLVKTQIPQFHRQIYTRDKSDLAEFEQEFCMKTWEIAAKHAIVKGNRPEYNLFRDKLYDLGRTNWKVAFPKNTEQCFRYGTCVMRELCVKDTPVARLAYTKRLPDYVDVAAGRAEKALNK